MENKNAKIIKKVKGLLAIAKDEKNDEESQSAFILAQKLMIQYDLDRQEVEESDYLSDFDKMNKESITIYKRLYWWERKLAIIIAENFKVKNYLNSKTIGKQRKRKIMFFGYGRDLELAKEMYILAYDAILFHSKKFINDHYEITGLKRTTYMTNSIKISYIDGFINGLSKRFEEQVSVLREKYEIVSLIPEGVERAYTEMEKNFGAAASFSAPQPEIVEAYVQGFNDGKDIDFTKSTLAEDIGVG